MARNKAEVAVHGGRKLRRLGGDPVAWWLGGQPEEDPVVGTFCAGCIRAILFVDRNVACAEDQDKRSGLEHRERRARFLVRNAYVQYAQYQQATKVSYRCRD